MDIKKSEVLSNRSIPLVRKKSEAEADAFFRKLSTENLKKKKEAPVQTGACEKSS